MTKDDHCINLSLLNTHFPALVSMAQMSFDALIIHNTSATWGAGPTNFTISHCTKVSVVIMGETSECCASASVTGSSCSECTNNIKGCFVEAETFEYGFDGGKESFCFNRTDVALRCLVCQPGYCSPTGTDFKKPLNSSSCLNL